MPVGKLTKTAVDDARPGGKILLIWDTELSGFGLKVTPSGKKVYLFQYRAGGRSAPTRRITIGQHGAITPEQARKEARRLRVEVDGGGDPAERRADDRQRRDKAKRDQIEQGKRAEALRIAALVEPYIEAMQDRSEKTGKPRTSTIEFYRQIIERHIVPNVGEISLPDLSFDDVDELLDTIPPGSTALRRNVFASLSAMSKWAVVKHRLAINPVAHYPRPDATASRKRILSDAELVMIWNAAGEMRKPLATFFRLLILTGQRRIEVAKMQWTELDRDREEWTVPGERAKNGNYHLVPLSAQALALIDDLAGGDEWPRQGPVLTLDGERSLGGFSKARRELDEKIDKALAEKPDASAFEQHWVIHDLRRTMATGLQRMGIRFEVTEAVLNHTGRSKGGIAGVYQLYEWRDEKREALVRWGREIQGIVSPQGGAKVIDLQWRAER